MASQSRHDLKSWMLKTIAAGFAALPLVLLLVVCLFVLAGTVHADIFVSNYYNNSVGKYHDDGTDNILNFLTGAATAEGVQCVKLTSNEVYVANANSPTIRVYNLTTGDHLPSKDFTIAGAIDIVAMAMNANATVLYGADYRSNHIWAVNLPIGLPGAPCTPASPCSVSTNSSLDVVVGPDGNVYASNRTIGAQGVTQFAPVGPSGWNPGSGTLVIQGTSYNGHSFSHAGAMIFDGSGNLWVTNSARHIDDIHDGIFEFTGPQNPNPFKPLNFTGDPNATPLGMDISPVNPPGPPVDPCKGCIVVAEFDGKPFFPSGDVDQIDPTTCTGTLANPGTCDFYNIFTPFITDTNGPKYVRFIENCNDTGYLEICKLTCVYNQVSGYFNFTATNQGTTVGPLSIPVNACSAPIQIPNGTVNIKETQRLGVVLNGVIAYNYDYFGNQISVLLSENLPFTNANVNVVSGDISTETVVGFTNCASGPGELKICKVAGSNDLVGDTFTFTAKGFGAPIRYTVPAGPPPGGYCVVAGSYQAGTPVLVTEPAGQNNSMVSNIAVAPPDRQGAKTGNSVIAVVDSGTTEVTFTDVDTPRGCSGPNLLINGSFETGDFTGWTVNNREGGLGVASGPIHNSPGAEDGQFYAQVSGGFQVSISQTLMTSPGQTYHVCFWLNAVGDPGSFFQGYWGTNQFLNLNPPNTGGVWQQYVEGAFTGTGGDTLQFVFQDQTGVLGLDNVVVSSP
jgi:hypothetical protein